MDVMLLNGDGKTYPAAIDKKGAVVFSKDKSYFSQSIGGLIVRSVGGDQGSCQ